ncbi:hypothetical protein P9112_002816 [Eukaryota sp. TZLM1-RC]
MTQTALQSAEELLLQNTIDGVTSNTSAIPQIDVKTPKIEVQPKKPKASDKYKKTQKGKNSNKKPMIRRSSITELKADKFPRSVHAIDIETKSTNENPAKKINQKMNEMRKKEADYLIKLSNEEQLQWVNNQEVFIISNVFGLFEKDEFYMQKSFITSCAKKPQGTLKLPDHCKYIYSFDGEEELLLLFVKFVTQHKPDDLTGFNVIKFDVPILCNRLHQVTNLFLQTNCNNFPTTDDKNDNFIELSDDEILNEDSENCFNQSAKTVLLNSTHPKSCKLLNDENWMNSVFPISIVLQNSKDEEQSIEVKSLLSTVQKHPQSCVKSAIKINNFIEEAEGKTFNAIPIARHENPGSFEVDSQGLLGILRSFFSK